MQLRMWPLLCTVQRGGSWAELLLCGVKEVLPARRGAWHEEVRQGEGAALRDT